LSLASRTNTLYKPLLFAVHLNFFGVCSKFLLRSTGLLSRDIDKSSNLNLKRNVIGVPLGTCTLGRL